MNKKTSQSTNDKITALKKIIEQQKNEISQLKNIIDDLPGDVYWKRCQGKELIYSGMNRTGIESLHKMGFKWKIGDIVENTDRHLFDKKTAEIFIKNDLEVIETGVARTREETAILPSGKKIIQLSTKRPLLDKKGHTIGVAGVSIDITKLKETQLHLDMALKKAEAANEAKTEFLENMRHDIRTPLSGIVGCAQLLQSEKLEPKKVSEYANDLVQSSGALLDFLNNVLEGIQVVTGEIPIVKKKFDVFKQLDRIVDLNKSLAAEKNLSLIFDYDKAIPLYLVGDPARLQRIVLELITNALTFTKKGKVDLKVKLKKNEARQVVLEITVSDTGIGIPGDKQEEIFIRFKRLTPSSQGIYKGLGLGLTMVKQFIEDLGGEIYVTSQLQKGSSFTCLIPFQVPLVMDHEGVEEIPLPFKIKTQAYKKPIETIGQEKGGGNRILLVEDDALAAKIAQMILSQLNCVIDVAPDAKTAEQKLQENDYQLILMDIGLPDMDGIALTHRIRLHQWQMNHSIPIIGLTAHIGQEKKQRCLDAGMNAVISKPLKKETADELLSTFVRDEACSQLSSIASPTRGAVVDFGIIKTLLEDDELIKECRELMLSGLSEDLEKLASWYQSSDWESIQAIAHKWRGAASYYGAKRLEQACEKLDVAWVDAGPNEKFNNLYEQLIQEMDSVIEVLKNYN